MFVVGLAGKIESDLLEALVALYLGEIFDFGLAEGGARCAFERKVHLV